MGRTVKNQLSIQGVSRVFTGTKGQRTQALQPIDFEVKENDFVTILGPSGCGKSTLLRIVAGLDFPTTGQVLANGPKMLLLDEPFGALDNQTRVLMQELLLGIWESAQKTVLFVTHDIDEAIFMANRVAVFSARPGRIKTEIAVDFPHPRSYTIKTSPEFMEIKARLTEEIRAESMAAAEH